MKMINPVFMLPLFLLCVDANPSKLKQKMEMKQKVDMKKEIIIAESSTPLQERVSSRISEMEDFQYFLDKSSPDIVDDMDIHSLALSACVYVAICAMKKWVHGTKGKWRALDRKVKVNVIGNVVDKDIVNDHDKNTYYINMRRVLAVVVLFLFKNVHSVS